MHNIKINFFWACLIVLFFFQSAYSAEAIDLRHQPSASQTSLFQSLSALANSPNLQQISRLTDAQGNIHIRSQQIYQGYPVIGAEQFIHIFPNGKSTKNGTLFNNLENDLRNTSSAVFTKKQADKAVQYALSQSNQIQPTAQKNQLAVYVDENHKAHWVFKIDFYFKNKVRDNPIYLLDAITFKIYKKWNGIQFFDKVKGGGLGGNPIIGTLVYDGFPGHKPTLDMMRDSNKAICYLQNDKVIVKDGRKELKNEREIGSDGFLHQDIPVLSFPCYQVNPEHGGIYWNDMLDKVNSASSPGNDALYLAGQIDQMFFDWFKISVLSNPLLNDQANKIYLVVHDWHGDAENSNYTLSWWDDSAPLEKNHIYIKLSDDKHSLQYKLITPLGNIVTDSIESSNIEEWDISILPCFMDPHSDDLEFLNSKEKEVIEKFLISKGYINRNYDGGSIFNAEWDPFSKETYFGDNGVYDSTTKKFITLTGFETLYPFVVPDIVAHELGHGFSQNHVNFNFSSEASAINESFSDMTAKAFEYYSTGKTTWTIGADMGLVLRYMDDPKKDCQSKNPCSIDHIKDYSPLVTESHRAAGILNKAFYLLATSPGWNTRRAFEVMVQANRYHWPSHLGFNEAACGIWDAASDLHAEMNSVSAAMAAVGLVANEQQCRLPS